MRYSEEQIIGFLQEAESDIPDVFDYIERFHNPRMRRRLAKQDLKFSAVLKPSLETG